MRPIVVVEVVELFDMLKMKDLGGLCRVSMGRGVVEGNLRYRAWIGATLSGPGLYVLIFEGIGLSQWVSYAYPRDRTAQMNGVYVRWDMFKQAISCYCTKLKQ